MRLLMPLQKIHDALVVPTLMEGQENQDMRVYLHKEDQPLHMEHPLRIRASGGHIPRVAPMKPQHQVYIMPYRNNTASQRHISITTLAVAQNIIILLPTRLGRLQDP